MSVYDEARKLVYRKVVSQDEGAEVGQALIDLVEAAEPRAGCTVFHHRPCGTCKGCHLDATLRRIREETT